MAAADAFQLYGITGRVVSSLVRNFLVEASLNDMLMAYVTSLNFALKIPQPYSVKQTRAFVGLNTAIRTQEVEVMTSGTPQKMDTTDMNMNGDRFSALLDETVVGFDKACIISARVPAHWLDSKPRLCPMVVCQEEHLCTKEILHHVKTIHATFLGKSDHGAMVLSPEPTAPPPPLPGTKQRFYYPTTFLSDAAVTDCLQSHLLAIKERGID